jgi:hypothetical protein
MQTRVAMNPQAEALKKRTLKLALRIVYFCRGLRKTWEVVNSLTRSFVLVHAKNPEPNTRQSKSPDS